MILSRILPACCYVVPGQHDKAYNEESAEWRTGSGPCSIKAYVKPTIVSCLSGMGQTQLSATNEI